MMYKKYKWISAFLVILFLILVSSDIMAQCPMCRMSAESNLQSGGSEGKGLNLGILYMLAVPYVMVGALGYVWWKNNRKGATEE